MLEIRGVSKTYTPKKGVPVKALDNVSLAFEETGMVFILGKSGSGKSTLLNVLGGLDKADCGEFIIKGKSSKDFSQADFDSYRNTFIGFIFQEYNILNEFTVAQNIALAMELQGKKATSEELSAILEEVDLAGYGNRKPNELSGGQKQRVAIARALIKHPEMIMADEPTGALDSKTGKQVFDTLKKLSKEKLVLIVSHDRDFAEQYADRIIELKDGKILSDVSKKNVPAVAHSEGVSVVDDKLIHIKKGYRLTERDLALINEYIANASADTLISIDGEKNAEIKKAAKINDEGGKDAFLDTKEEDVKLKTYTAKDSRLIRSKLPYKNALKIGTSSLKAKPIRLAFTVFLCFIAFALFGLADTMASYNRANAMLASIEDGNIQTLSLYKRLNVDYYTDLRLTKSDINKLKTELSANLVPVYSGPQAQSYNFGFSLSSIIDDTSALQSPNGESVYNAAASGYAEYTEAFLAENGIQMVAGRLPQADDEIAIPKFIYDQLKLGGLVYTETVTDEHSNSITQSKTLKADQITGYSDIVGKSIQGRGMLFPPTKTETAGGILGGYYFQEAVVKIVGIFDTHFDAKGYEDFMPDAERKDGSLFDSLTGMKLSAMRDYGFHTVIAVNAGMLDKMVEYNKNNNMYGNAFEDMGIRPQNEGGNVTLESNGMSFWIDKIYSMSDIEKIGVISWIGEEKTTLAKNEILVPLSFDYEKGNNLITEDVIQELEQALGVTFTEDQKNELLQWNLHSLLNISEYFVQMIVQVPKQFAIDYLCQMNGWEGAQTQIQHHNYDGTVFEGTVEEYIHSDAYAVMDKASVEYEYAFKVLHEFGDDNPYDSNLRIDDIKTAAKIVAFTEAGRVEHGKFGTMEIRTSDGKESVEYTVVGYVIPTETDYLYGICVGDDVYNLYGKVPNGDYLFALGKMPEDKAALRALVEYTSKTHENFVEYSLQNEPAAILDYVGDLIDTMAEIFLYIGIGFAVFASLMMFNFITVSVSYKKREIGILRAVGSRSRDVFFIFFNESLVITLINFVLSAVTVGVVSSILNGLFRGYGIPVTVLTFGIRQIGLLLGVGIVVAFIGSFLPVMKIARKRPIDAIQNR